MREQEDRDAEILDIEHYAELHPDLDGAEGYKVYGKLRDVRRERRKLKNENELLKPFYDWLGENTQAVKKLEQALGKTRNTAEVIDNRKYMTRTGVLNESE